MAKDKRPVNMQVADLTVEQRNRIPRIALYHILFSVLALVLVVVLAFVPMFTALSDYTAAGDKADETFNAWLDAPTLSAEKEACHLRMLEAEKDELAAKQEFSQKMTTCLIALGAWLIIEVVIILVVYKKYPYYSDRKCFYILFHRKELV